MLSKIITVLRQPTNEVEGTGTFADGVFPLTLSEQSAFDKGHSLRTSYGRDYSTARKLDVAPSSYV